jgi:Tfp pilus assembly protein PilF
MRAGTPTDATTANRLGLDALRSGQAEAASEHFERACRADPAAAELFVNLATARRLLKDDAAERSALEQALGIDQRNLMALIRLAQLHERLGEDKPATQRWSAVLSLASSIDQPSPEFAGLLVHARSYVENQRRELAVALDAALASDLAAASTRDRRRASAARDVILGRRTVFANECHGLHYGASESLSISDCG